MNNIDAAFKGAAGLTRDYYEALVAASLAPQKLAITRAKQRQDELEVKAAVYDDLESKLNSLSSAVDALRQISGEDSVFDSKKATSSDTSYVTATATSDAADGSYEIHVDNLAVKHRVWSDQQASGFTLDLGGTGNTAQFKIRSGTDPNNDITVTVNHGDTLEDIRDAINQAFSDAIDAGTITEDYGVTASVVDNHLVIESDSTGTAYALAASDVSGTVLEDLNIVAGAGDTDADSNGFVDSNETNAEDAQFTVNGINVTRSANTDLDDVITGVTLNLTGEHGTSNTDAITLTVAPDTGAVTTAINSFISSLNSLTSWLDNKTGVKENSDGTYTRGVLSDDFSLRSLRRTLVQTAFATWDDAPVNATYTRLDEIGLELGDGLVASLADSSALESALSSNYDEVVSLFDGVMQDVATVLSPYTEGTETLVDKLQEAADTALDDQNSKIDRLESALERREEILRDQIARQFAAISSYNDQGRFIVSSMFNTFG